MTGRRSLTLCRGVVVLAPALLGAGVCAIGLTSRSLWLDEGASIAIASQHGGALWHGIAHDGGNMLVFYLALHVLIGWFGDGLVTLRIISLLCDGLTAGLVAALGMALFRRREVALVAGVLSALSVGLIFWGQDARGYAAMVTAVTASFLALVRMLDDGTVGRDGTDGRGGTVGRDGADGRDGAVEAGGVLGRAEAAVRDGLTGCGGANGHRRPGAGAWIGFVIAMILALYLGFDAVLVVPAQLAIALLLGGRRRLVWLLAALAVVALACIPLAVLAVSRGSSQLFWVPALGPGVLWQALVTLVSAGLPPNFHVTVVTVVATVVTTLVTGGVLVRVGCTEWRRRRRSLSTGAEVVGWLWLVLTGVIVVAAAAVGEPLELARISILLMPALALVLASGLRPRWDAEPNTSGPSPAGGPAAPAPSPGENPPGPVPSATVPLRPGLIGTVALAVILALRVAVLIPAYAETPEPWKEVVARVLDTARPGDCVAFYPQDGRMPFAYYVQHDPDGSSRAPRAILPMVTWSSTAPHVESYRVPTVAQLRRRTAACDRVWLIAAHQGQPHGPLQSRRNFAGYLELQRRLAGILSGRSTRSDLGYAARIELTLYRRSNGPRAQR